MKTDLENLISHCRFIDGHTHSDKYDEPEKTGMIRSVEKNRILTLSSSTDPPSMDQSRSLHDKCPWILTAAGIHPWNAGEFGPEDVFQKEGYYENAHQISEIGMDGLWAPEEATLIRQEALLELQLSLAVRFNKPVTLHTKSAEDQVLALLNKNTPPSVLIHWFDGSSRQLFKYLDLGCFFTIPPSIITSPESRDIIKKVPLNRLLPETDNPPTWPWLFNQSARAEQILSVTEASSELLGQPVCELMKIFRETISSFLQISFPLH